ncbi:MAG: LuxR family transcriptional regulator, partial [Spirochaetaceae bacterium]
FARSDQLRYTEEVSTQEREKELRAVYELAARFTRTDGDLETLLQETSEILRLAMKFPERSGVEIRTLRRRVTAGPEAMQDGAASLVLDECEVIRHYSDQQPLQIRVWYLGLASEGGDGGEDGGDYSIEEWEQRLVESCGSLLADVLQRREMDEILRETTKLLQTQAAELEGKNHALREVLSQIESEKKAVQERAVSYIETYVRPELEHLKMSDRLGTIDRQRIDAVIAGLDEVFSDDAAFVIELGRVLTCRELEVAQLIRRGLSSKEIAQQLNLSESTVDRHRNTIRKKLHLNHQGISLMSYLRSGDM